MIEYLVIDSIADFFMDKSNLGLPILLFSLGHIVKQIAYNNGILSKRITNYIP